MNAVAWMILVGLLGAVLGASLVLVARGRMRSYVPLRPPARESALARAQRLLLGAECWELGGRRFSERKVWSIELDIWLDKKLYDGGLSKMEKPPDDDPDAMVDVILGRLWRSGEALEVLGAWLIEVDEDPMVWSVERARERAKFIGGLTDDVDRLVARGLFSKMVADFFERRLVSWRTSPSSSRSREAGGSGMSQSTGAKAGGSPITASGASPSTNSPGATPAGYGNC